jgi:2-iminoacetate synthase ThiH
MTVREFLQRINGISDMLGNSMSDLSGFAHQDEIERQMRFKEEAAELARKAKEQGMPPSWGGALRRSLMGSMQVQF